MTKNMMIATVKAIVSLVFATNAQDASIIVLSNSAMVII